MADREPDTPERTVVLPVPATLTGRSQASAEAMARRRVDHQERARHDATAPPGRRARHHPGGRHPPAVGRADRAHRVGGSDHRRRPHRPGRQAARPGHRRVGGQGAEGLHRGDPLRRGDPRGDRSSASPAAPRPSSRRAAPCRWWSRTDRGPASCPGACRGPPKRRPWPPSRPSNSRPASTASSTTRCPRASSCRSAARPGETLPRGGTVTIEVSRGPEMVTVPDVKKADTPAQAAAILRAAGLVPGSVSGSSEGKPKSTTPKAGTRSRRAPRRHRPRLTSADVRRPAGGRRAGDVTDFRVGGLRS